MANLYWVGGSGNWSDNTNHWSTSSGGAPGASNPDSIADDVIFDANSFSIDGSVVTMDVSMGPGTGAGFNAWTLDSSAIIKTVTFFVPSGNIFTISGATTLSGLLTVSGEDLTSQMALRPGAAATLNFTPSGCTLHITLLIYGDDSGIRTIKLIGDLVAQDIFVHGSDNNAKTTFDANGYNVTCWSCKRSFFAGFGALNMGSGVWKFNPTYSEIIFLFNNGIPGFLNIGTASVIVNIPAGITASFALGTSESWNSFTINGTSSTTGTFSFVSDGNTTASQTFSSFTVANAPIKLILISGRNYTVTGTLTMNGLSGRKILLRSSSLSTSTLSASLVSLSYIDVQYNTAAGAANPFFVCPGGVDSGNNTNWTFCNPNQFLQTVYMVGADTDGDVQTINAGKSDDGDPIYYELETQELEFGNRMHLKKVANNIAVFTNFGSSSSLLVSSDNQDYQPVNVPLSNRVNIGQDIDIEGHFITFKWLGSATQESPIFEGLWLENISDLGMTYG